MYNMEIALPATASLVALLILFTLVWRASVKLADAGIIDLFWAGGFVLAAAVEAALNPPTEGGWIMLTLVGIWAARLTSHLVHRHRNAQGEDARYAAMRREGGPDWPAQSLKRVFLVQALALWAVATPIHATLLPGAAALQAGPIAVVGGVLFLLGLATEAAADWQLMRFKADPARRGQILQDGLYAICRHPNYLGEIMVWWGLGLVAFGLTDRVWALGGPALLTFFIVKVSGVPPLEAVLAARPGYAEWAERTPALWPRWATIPGKLGNIKKGA
jgi:steroid 5-alpha reductase family enzyme